MRLEGGNMAMASGTETALGLAAAYKLLLSFGVGAAAIAAIWKLIKWLQGPAADNKVKLENMSTQIADLTTTIAVLASRVEDLASDNAMFQRAILIHYTDRKNNL